MEKEIVATWSPCCKVLREGKQRPGIMHSAFCKEVNGGRCGPTVYLSVESVAPDCAPLDNYQSATLSNVIGIAKREGEG